MSLDFEPRELEHVYPCFLIPKDPFAFRATQIHPPPVTASLPGVAFSWVGMIGITHLSDEEIVVQLVETFARYLLLHVVCFATDNWVNRTY